MYTTQSYDVYDMHYTFSAFVNYLSFVVFYLKKPKGQKIANNLKHVVLTALTPDDHRMVTRSTISDTKGDTTTTATY